MGRLKPYTGSTSKKAEDLFCTPAKQETAAPRWGISSFHDSLSQQKERFKLENGATRVRLIQTDARDGFGVKFEGASDASVLLWVGGSTISAETVSPSGTSNATFRAS